MDQGLTGSGLTQDIKDACAMARDMIETCQSVGGHCEYNWVNRDNQKASIRCNYFRDRTCPARVYLARHGNNDAWVCGATGGLAHGARGVAAGVSG